MRLRFGRVRYAARLKAIFNKVRRIDEQTDGWSPFAARIRPA